MRINKLKARKRKSASPEPPKVKRPKLEFTKISDFESLYKQKGAQHRINVQIFVSTKPLCSPKRCSWMVFGLVKKSKTSMIIWNDTTTNFDGDSFKVTLIYWILKFCWKLRFIHSIDHSSVLYNLCSCIAYLYLDIVPSFYY